MHQSSQRVNLSILTFLLLFLFLPPNAAAINQETITIKGDFNYPPYEFINHQNQPAGFNIDIMRAVAREMGLNITIELDSWPTVREELKNGEIDAVTGAFKTAARHKHFNFSNPHVLVSYSMVSRPDTPLPTPERARNQAILVQAGDFGHDYLIENNITQRIITKNSVEEALVALSSGQGCCALVPRLQSMMIIKKFKLDDLISVGPPIMQREFCFGVAKGNDQLLATLNEGLSIIHTTGEYDRIYQKWFGHYESLTWKYQKLFKRFMLITAAMLLVITLSILWSRMLSRRVKERTRELKASRENLKITLNSIGDGVIATDIEGRVTRLNPIAEHLTGWGVAEAKGRPLTEIFVIVNASSREAVENPVDRVLSSGQIVGLANHTILLSRSGQEYQISDSAAPIRTAEGQLTGVVLVFRDVTHDYAMKAALKAEQERALNIINSSPSMIVGIDSSGLTTFINPAVTAITGYTEDDLLGNNWWEILYPDEYYRQVEKLQQNFTECIVMDHEMVLRAKDGSSRTILWCDYCNHDESNNIREIIGFGSDITDRREAERAKADSDLRYATLFESAGEAVFLLKNGKFYDCNPKTLQMFGCRKDEIIGRSPADFSPELQPNGQRSSEVIKMRLERDISDKQYLFEWQQQRLDKTPFDAEVSLSRMELGQETYTLAIVRDITERNRMQQELMRNEEQLRQSQKMDAIGQLAGGVAHDFNNMLSVITNAAEMLSQQDSLDADSRQLVDMILTAGQRSAELTTKLLAFGRKGRTTSEHVDIHNLIEETRAILSRTVDKKIEIIIDTQAGCRIVEGDTSSLQNAVLNICINASHAISGRGQIAIATRNREMSPANCRQSSFEIDPGAYLELMIRDSGCGIAPHNLDKIFEPFFTTKEKGIGTGLGLAAVYGTIRDHHGAIEVQSRVGLGTTFTILLPCIESAQIKESDNSAIINGSGCILLVDDEELIRNATSMMLKRMGYRVMLAGNGEEAVATFAQHHQEIDLVIMDMIMPVMNGRDAFIKMRSIDSSCKVLIASGFTNNANIAELEKMGLNGFIAKPFRNFELNRRIREIL